MPGPALGRRKDGALAAFGEPAVLAVGLGSQPLPAHGAMLSPFCAADQDRGCLGFYAVGPLLLAGKRQRLQLGCPQEARRAWSRVRCAAGGEVCGESAYGIPCFTD